MPLLWDTLGTVYTYDTSLKNYDRAIACFERGLQQQPENGMLNFHMGATLAKKGDYEQGVHYLEIARQLQSDLPDVYKFLAYVYRDQGQLQLAVDNLNKYLQLKPDAFDQPKVRKDVEDIRAQLKSGAARG
jgi:tetratricopeptide (TPR) repeat protein